MEIVLIYPTPEGSVEIALKGEKLSFGRGSEADYRFEDDGLSRLHATIYRDGDNVWIIDEGSTNGTFVNGKAVSSSGTPLESGDTIKIGNYTDLRVKIIESTSAPAVRANSSLKSPVISSQPRRNLAVIIPVAVITGAFFIISISAALIAVKAIRKDEPVVVKNTGKDDSSADNPDNKENSNQRQTTPTSAPPGGNNLPIDPEKTPVTTPSPSATLSPGNQNFNLSGKKYLELGEADKRKYIETRAQKVAALIGNRSSGEIPALAIDRIKGFLDAYARRANVGKMSGCRFGDNLQSTYERASKNAPFIIRAFNQEGIDPQIGMYLAMIESEHCVCLQSPTGPLGMFQFTKATGETYGLRVARGASPANPDERCEPEPAARAAAKYMKFLTGRYGTSPSSFPLAIGSYNSGEGGLSTNLKVALEANEGLPRDFWTLIANGEKLSKQFQSENFKYVPKFFAAAIIGENPSDFGLNLQPLSTYTK